MAGAAQDAALLGDGLGLSFGVVRRAADGVAQRTAEHSPTPAPASASRGSPSSAAHAVAKTSPTPTASGKRRTLIDIVFEKGVHHADAQVKHCPRCHTETRAPFPDTMPGPLQYGNGLKACVVHLLVAQRLSLKRATHSVHALIAQTLSEATLLHFVLQLHHALAEWERRAVERLLTMPALHVDETSLRVDRNNHWLHVYSGGSLTVKRLHPKRGCEAIEAIGILPRYGGVAVHDCRASSLSYAHCDCAVRRAPAARAHLHHRRP